MTEAGPRPHVAHIDDDAQTEAAVAALSDLHPGYSFRVHRWHGGDVQPVPQAVRYLFAIRTGGAYLTLEPGDTVRGATAAKAHTLGVPAQGRRREEVWPGDVVAVADGQQPARLDGEVTALEVSAPPTGYPVPRLTLLRELPDAPGGCAAYPGAFRREALPPMRPTEGAADQRGVNRVNQHTLDMRPDRRPLPLRHCHGPVAVGPARWVAHSETAVVLPRAAYDLPLVEGTEDGEVLLYPDPETDPGQSVAIAVRPGSIVVTPATEGGAVGHCFLNAFAMLVAIPGFVSPYRLLGPAAAPVAAGVAARP